MAAQSSAVSDNGLLSPIPYFKGRSSSFSARKRNTPEQSPPSFPAIPASVKGFMNRFNAGNSSCSKIKNPSSLGQRAGVGVHPEGGLRKIKLALVRHHSFLGGQHANPLQFFVSEKALLDMAGALHMADSRFPGNSANLCHG